MKAQKLCMLASAFSAALFSMSTAQAADVTTEDVKVTASRVEQELMDVNMSVSVITADDIAHSEARTIGDLLKDVPGVQINSDGGQGMKRAQIRGEDSFRTLVMIDGQKIAEHKSMSGSPMLIDPSMVERIEVIKGPASVLYGSDAIGGAINIITKKGGNKPFEAEVSAGMDNASNGKTAAASIYGGINGWPVGPVMMTCRPLLCARLILAPILFRALKSSETLGVASELKGLGTTKRTMRTDGRTMKTIDARVLSFLFVFTVLTVLAEIFLRHIWAAKITMMH